MKTTRLLALALASIATLASAQAPEWKTLSDQAIAAYRKGDLDAAEAAGTRALEAANAAMGSEHLNVATTQANLATILEARKKYAEAQALQARALAIREKQLGPDHALVASSLNNLASLYRDQGKTAEAEPLFARALAIRQKALGPDHADVATSLNNLAAVYRQEKKYAQAEPLYVRALSIRENFTLPTVGRDTVAGLVRPSSSERRLSGYVDRLRIKLGRSSDGIMTLSGGNQQKVVIARWLASQPRILLLNDPTRGVDLGAKRDIYDLLAELTAEGIAVVMLSTEVDELIELMDRVLVFKEGELEVELGRGALTRSVLVASYFGQKQPADV